MKKYQNKLLGIVLLTLFLLSFALLKPLVNNSYAQSYKSIKFFDMSNPVYQTHIAKSQLNQSDTQIKLSPITQIVINRGSFNEDVDLSVYQGDWNILTKGPNAGNSPISTYYFVFLNSQGKEVQSLLPLAVFVNNIYFSGTNAVFTPIVHDTGEVDATAIRTSTNQSIVQAILPIGDAGYILAINKVVDKNLLMQKQTGNSLLNLFFNQNVYLILLIIVIIIAIAGLIMTVSTNNSKRQNKNL